MERTCQMKIFIKPGSIRAKYAARIMKVNSIAIVFGNTIHLWNCTGESFLKNTRWLRHETAHVLQFKKYGNMRFYFLYLIEHFKKGYTKNKFEIEAREKEADENILNEVELITISQ
jgi:hypothetical protein